jgi:hypothetical protein
MQIRKHLDNRHLNFVLPPVGHELHFTCDTNAGAKRMLSQGKRFWCPKCQTMETVVLVRNIVQHESRVDYDCQLTCDCFRWVSMSVSRTPSGKKQLQEEKARAARAKRLLDAADVPETDPETELTDQIRQDMRADGTLIESGEESDSGDPQELGLPLIKVWDGAS